MFRWQPDYGAGCSRSILGIPSIRIFVGRTIHAHRLRCRQYEYGLGIRAQTQSNFDRP